MNISKLGKYFDLPFGYISLVLPISVLILEMSIITPDNLRLKTKVRFGLFQKGLEGIIVISKRMSLLTITIKL